MKRAICAATALALLLCMVAPAEAGTIVVTGPDQYGWVPNITDSNGVPVTDSLNTMGNPTGAVNWVTGPATPPLGVGSLNLQTGNGTVSGDPGNGTMGGDGSAQIDNVNYNGVPLASLTALSYSTYDTLNNGQQFPYLSLTIETVPGDPTSEHSLFFEPPYQTPSTGSNALPDQGATVMSEWQTWNALTGGWWDNNGIGNPGTGVVSLATIELAYPGRSCKCA